MRPKCIARLTVRLPEELLQDIKAAAIRRCCSESEIVINSLEIGTQKAARYLDVPESTIRQWVRMRQLPCFREGKRLLFRVRELDQWIERRRLERKAL